MSPARPAGIPLDRRGVALPLALLGLVAVTLLVTTALVTGSTESAISNSQQDASQRLYLADAGIEAFLRQKWIDVGDASPQPLSAGRDTLTLNGQQVVIDVSRLRNNQVTIDEVRDPVDGRVLSPMTFRRTETFSLVASPRRGGRAVGAMYTTDSEWSAANLNINSAGSVAADLLRIPGNSGAMSGVDQSGCADVYDGTEGGTDALAISDSVVLDLDTARVLEAEDGYSRVVRTDMNRYEFALHVLGGNTPEALAANADIKWGDDLPAVGGGTVDGRPITGSGLGPGPGKTLESGLNWGCPAGSHKLGERAIAFSACTRSIQDTSRYPVIAVKSPGGSFKIQGYGQGFLIVIGDVDLRDLNFFGVVVVTGDVQLNGTGYIGGAFVSLGDATLGVENQQQDGDETLWNGRTFVRFNRCGLNAAQAALAGQNGANAQQQFDGRSLSWFEIVR